ncbi:polyprenyl synthetase family protein [Pseudonocardia lacus]|uniref:polyprenyl synthetase family protein n=1 Tax=Pseudonocardia lacus TaxID=2835865 RepID=UPI001BDCB316|nr:polyprenyl synthetase family protein [Pseudonocardia lacus]
MTTAHPVRAGVPRPREPHRDLRVGAGEVLRACRAVVDPALRAAIDTLPASVVPIAGYHMGWLEADGSPCAAGSGKAVRPALVLAAAGAVGGRVDAALPGAVAVELVHNFSLLHDDVMDDDVTRRHRPTAWTVFGTGPAILAGDALLALAMDVLAGSGHPAAEHAVRVLSAAVQDLVAGQLADLEFERVAVVDVARCLEMAGGKTASLLGCSAALGALLAGAGREEVDLLDRAARDLGLAFQFVDDLLGIWGDPRVTGKAVGNDLRHRKKSLPVVAALTSGTPEGAELADLYARAEEPGADEVRRAAGLVERSGAADWCREQVELLLAAALRRIRALPGPVDDLVALAHLIARRDH